MPVQSVVTPVPPPVYPAAHVHSKALTFGVEHVAFAPHGLLSHSLVSLQAPASREYPALHVAHSSFLVRDATATQVAHALPAPVAQVKVSAQWTELL